MPRSPKVFAKKRILPGRVVAARLTPEESEAFDALLALEAEKGNDVSGSWFIRMLVRKEARRRKLLD